MYSVKSGFYFFTRVTNWIHIYTGKSLINGMLSEYGL